MLHNRNVVQASAKTDRDDQAEVEAALRKAIEIDPNDGFAWATLADLL